MSIRLPFLENIRTEFDRLNHRTSETPDELRLYKVVATPKPSASAGALSVEDLVCLEMTCGSGATRVTEHSIPDDWPNWAAPATIGGERPSRPGVTSIDPWPNVPLEEAWTEVIKRQDIGAMVESVTLHQRGGLRVPPPPKYDFLMVGGDIITVDAWRSPA